VTHGDQSEKLFIDPPNWPKPTPDMLASPEFNAVWEAIKDWDINVPNVYAGYCGASATMCALSSTRSTHAKRLIVLDLCDERLAMVPDCANQH
jgi:hypothetical protein